MYKIYKEALRLHELTFTKCQSNYFTKSITLTDTSHLPNEIYDLNYLSDLNKKIFNSRIAENFKNGKFICELTEKEALILLLKVNFDNINYKQEVDIDLENYQLGADIYKIELTDGK